MVSRVLSKGLVAVIIAVGQTVTANAQELTEDVSADGHGLAHLPEIVISADPLRPGLSASGSAASVVEREEALIKRTPSLGETLSGEPGVNSSYFGPGSSRPIIRGNSGERVRVLRNGVGTLDVSNLSEDHAVTVDPYTIEQAEVLRGPETLLYGSSAIGGVVNVTDGSIPEEVIGVPATGEVDYRMGTADEEASGGGVLRGGLGAFNWSLSGYYRDSDDVEIPGFAESEELRAQESAEGEAHEESQPRGTLPNSFTLTRTGTAGASYVWEKGFVGAAVSTYRSKYGVPGHAHEEEEAGEGASTAEEPGVAIDLEQVRLDLRSEVRGLGRYVERLRFRGGISDYDHKELEGAEVGTTFENDGGEVRIEAVQRERDGLSGAVGLQVQVQDFTSEGEEAFIPSNTTLSPALFVFEQYQVNDYIKLQVGGRSEYSRVNPDGRRTEEFYPFSLSTGGTVDPTGTAEYTAGLSLSYAQRSPTATELFADGAHVARQIVERGDETLDEERSWGSDLTFKANAGVLTGALNLFYQRYDNFINLSGTGEEEEGFTVFAYEDVRAEFWGFEFDGTLHLHELLGWYEHLVELDAGLDFVRARNLSDGGNLPRIPPLRTTLRARYDWKSTVGAEVEGIFVEEQDDLAPFEIMTVAYRMFNATVDYKLPIGDEGTLTLYVRGVNLSDEEARVHSSFLKDLAPLPGRSILFGVRGIF